MNKQNKKTRNRVRMRFIEHHRKLFDALHKRDDDLEYWDWRVCDEFDAISDKARELIGYSPKTVDWDIVMPLYRAYVKIYY